MPELRRDPVAGYWTIISTERARRPVEFSPGQIHETRRCPFCEGRESETTEELYAVRKPDSKANGPGWQVRAVTSKMPILSPGKDLQRQTLGIYEFMPAQGAHELIIESPRHTHSLDELEVSDIEKVVRVYVQRLNELGKNERLKYALLFKNQGLISGSASDVIRHTRTQLIATPITPKRVKEELAYTKRYFSEHGRCVFCDVLEQEIRSGERVVAENRSFVAFCPFASRSPFEMWIVPRMHQPDFGSLESERFFDLAALLKDTLQRLRALLVDPPYNLLLHTAPFRHNHSDLYWRTIDEDYHWYFQIAPRLTHEAGFEWGTGVFINPTPPEDAADLLREAYATAS